MKARNSTAYVDALEPRKPDEADNWISSLRRTFSTAVTLRYRMAPHAEWSGALVGEPR